MMYNHNQLVWIELEKLIKEKNLKGKVLDVGCRNAVFKEEFEKNGFEWTGIDLVPQHDSVFSCDMTEITWSANEFDLVFVCHSFEHCTNPIEALREFKRVLKPDGYLFIATPYPNKHHILDSDSDHWFVLNEYQMIRLLANTGFTGNVFVSKLVEKEDDWNIISIARKKQ